MMRIGLIAVVLLALTGGDRAQAVSGLRVKAGPLSQTELLSGRQVSVRMHPPAGSHTQLRVRLVGGGAQYGLGQTRMSGTTRIRVGFPLSRRALVATSGCGRLFVVVKAVVRAHGATLRRRTKQRVDREPPFCGRFFSDSSIWNQPLSDDAPVDPSSKPIMTAFLQEILDSYRTHVPPWINTSRFSTPVYTVSRHADTVPVILDPAARTQTDLRDAFAHVPIPTGARPAAGTDANMVVWQPARDRLWEFYRMRRAADGWHATYGGRMEHVSTGPGHYTGEHARWGATASSLPLAGGIMTPRELARGKISHALSMAIPNVRAHVFSLPAQRTDGRTDRDNALPEGAHLRLDPDLDLDALNLPAPMRAIARAAQKYGIYIRDGGTNVALYGQDPTPFGVDPYPQLFGGMSAGELMRWFPWSHLQVLRMDLRRDSDSGGGGGGPAACQLLHCR